MITCCKCRYRPRPGPPLAGREEALSWKSKRLRKCFESLKIVLEMQMIKKMFWDVTETQMIFHISYLWFVFSKIVKRDLRAQFQNFFTSKKLEQSFIFLVFVWSFLPERRWKNCERKTFPLRLRHFLSSKTPFHFPLLAPLLLLLLPLLPLLPLPLLLLLL